MSDQEFLHGSIHGSLLAVISKPHRGYWALLMAAWIWAIWSCAEYWRGNPNYSYGWIVPVLYRLEFRVTAALAFLRQHEPGAALAQFQGPPIEWAKTSPSWRAVYAAALRGNEREEAAHEIIAMIPIDKLSSEERTRIEAK
jgi:hypothetical protein